MKPKRNQKLLSLISVANLQEALSRIPSDKTYLVSPSNSPEIILDIRDAASYPCGWVSRDGKVVLLFSDKETPEE